MAGNNLLHMLRGSAVNATTILDPGQPFYNLIKNYVTVGGKDADGNGVTPINGKPVAARELVGYVGDTDSAIGNNTTELYKITYAEDALKFMIEGNEQLAVSNSGVYASKILGNFYGDIVVNKDSVDTPYKLRVSSKLFDNGLSGFITDCVDSNGYTYSTIYDTVDDAHFGFNTSCEVDLRVETPGWIDLGVHSDCVIKWDALKSNSDFTCLNHKHNYTKGSKYLCMYMQNGVVPPNIFRDQPLAYHDFSTSDLRELSHGCFYGTFDNTNSKAIRLPRSLERIDDFALGMHSFYDDNKAKSMYIPNSVNFIGIGALPLKGQAASGSFFTIFRQLPYEISTAPSNRNIFIVNDNVLKSVLVDTFGTACQDYINVFEESMDSIIPDDSKQYARFVDYSVDDESNNYINTTVQFATGGSWGMGYTFDLIGEYNDLKCTLMPTDMVAGKVKITVELKNGTVTRANGSVTLGTFIGDSESITFDLNANNRKFEAEVTNPQFSEAFSTTVPWTYSSDTTYYVPARSMVLNFKLPAVSAFSGATLDGVEASYKLIKSNLPYDVRTDLKHAFMDGYDILNNSDDEWQLSTSGTITLAFANNISSGLYEILNALFYSPTPAMKVVLGDKNEPLR